MGDVADKERALCMRESRLNGLRRPLRRQLAFEEHRRALLVASRLADGGRDVRRGVASPGLVAAWRGSWAGRTGLGLEAGLAPPHHGPEFSINEAGLLPAARVALRILLDALSPAEPLEA
jgi:hypothetical protein